MYFNTGEGKTDLRNEKRRRFQFNPTSYEPYFTYDFIV